MLESHMGSALTETRVVCNLGSGGPCDRIGYIDRHSTEPDERLHIHTKQ